MDRRTLITDSEWQVMRILWENSPQTATQITAALRDAQAWSPTTVKTFLSRLVAKELLAYEKHNKAYFYSPLVSERYCVKQEMKAVLNRLYGGTKQLETEHFVFFGEKQPAYATALAIALEKHFPRLSQDLDYSMSEKQMVYLYSSQKRLHSALGLSNGPSWLRAGLEWDILHIAPASTFDDLRPEDVIVHVFAQVIVRQMNESAPYWLQQGIAAYESQWMSKERILEALRQERDKLDFRCVHDLTKRYDEFRDQHGYELAYTVVEHIVMQYGQKALVRFLKNPENLSAIFQCEESTFWQTWLSFIKSKYLNKEESL